MRGISLVLFFALASCARKAPDAELTQPSSSGTNGIVVTSGSPSWAYRLGPEIFATLDSDSSAINFQLRSIATQRGCDAVVSVVIPPRDAPDPRPYGFCAYRFPAKPPTVR